MINSTNKITYKSKCLICLNLGQRVCDGTLREHLRALLLSSWRGRGRRREEGEGDGEGEGDEEGEGESERIEYHRSLLKPQGPYPVAYFLQQGQNS
jgi:hypothetical protein